ncbi:DNA helicase [Arthrobacter phage Pterodactyl]|uniref:DNA helicase n=1 Tax=Arthrobacter phage Pterodactyl TaxID=2499014 RepID=A0A3S9UGP6_9CAUD|nr:DNA helicase [Arthrobacter phage Pterodactyl]
MDQDREKGPLRRRAWPGQISAGNRGVRWAKQPKRDHRPSDGYQRRHMAGPTGPVVRVSGELDCYSVFGYEPPRENGQRRIETYIKTGPGAYRVVSRLSSGRESLHERTQHVLDEECRAAREELRSRVGNDRDADPELGTRNVHPTSGDVPGEGQAGWPVGVVLEMGGDVVRRRNQPTPGAREGDRTPAGLSSRLLLPPAVSAVRTLLDLHERESRPTFLATAEGGLYRFTPGDESRNPGADGWTAEETLPRDEETLHDGSGRQGDSVMVNWGEACGPRSDFSLSVAFESDWRTPRGKIRAVEIRPRREGKTYAGLSALSGCCGGMCGCGEIDGGYRCDCSRWEFQDGQWVCSPGLQGWEAGRVGRVPGDGVRGTAAYGGGYGDLCRNFLQAVSERAGSAARPPARADSPGDYQGVYNSGYRRCEQASPAGGENDRSDSVHVGGRFQENAVGVRSYFRDILGIELEPWQQHWLDNLARYVVD